MAKYRYLKSDWSASFDAQVKSKKIPLRISLLYLLQKEFLKKLLMIKSYESGGEEGEEGEDPL